MKLTLFFILATLSALAQSTPPGGGKPPMVSVDGTTYTPAPKLYIAPGTGVTLAESGPVNGVKTVTVNGPARCTESVTTNCVPWADSGGNVAVAPTVSQLYVDTYAAFFGGVAGDVPSGVAGWTENQGQLTVTGAAGSSTMTVGSYDVGVAANYGNGGESQYSNFWGAVVQHDDGTYGIYSVKGAATGTITVRPRLTKPVTAGKLWNLFDQSLGQHLTAKGYTALAYYLAGLKVRDGLTDKLAGQMAYDGAGTAVGTALTAVGGLTTGGYVVDPLWKGIFAAPGSGAGAAMANGTVCAHPDCGFFNGYRYVTGAAAGVAGQGLGTGTVYLGGQNGLFTADVAISDQINAGTMPSTVTVAVTIDGSVVYTAEVAGLKHISVPFYSAKTGSATFTLTTSAGTGFKVSYANWYVWPSTINADGPLIATNALIVLLMDSWGVNHNNAFATAMAAAFPGSVVINNSLASQQATWGIANFDALVTAAVNSSTRPVYVISNFGINDANASVANATWLNNILQIGQMSQNRGVTSVTLRNTLTPSYSQVGSLVLYANEFSAGSNRGVRPVLSSCGTSPTIIGTNTQGTVTMGTGSPTACTLTFAPVPVSVPSCTVSPEYSATAYISAKSATAVTVTFSAAGTGSKFSYKCSF